MKPDRDGSGGGRVSFRPGGGAESRLVHGVTEDRKSAGAKAEEDEDWRVRWKKMMS